MKNSKFPKAGGYKAAFAAKRKARRSKAAAQTPKEHWAQVMADYIRERDATIKQREDQAAKQQDRADKLSASRGDKLASTQWLLGDKQGEDITPENFRSQVFDFGTFDPSYLGEQNYPAIVESILYGDANWIPKNENLNRDNIPSWWVTGT